MGVRASPEQGEAGGRAGGEELALQRGIEGVQAHDHRRRHSPGDRSEPALVPPPLVEGDDDDRRGEEEGGLLGEDGEGERDPAADHPGQAPPPVEEEVQAHQQPEHHDVVEQQHPLVSDRQGGGGVEQRRQGGEGAGGPELVRHPVQERDARQVEEQHQHAAALDRAAERLRAPGQPHPGGHQDPAGGGVVVGVGVGRQPPLAEHREGLPGVDALVVVDRGVAEHVQTVGDEPDPDDGGEEEQLPPVGGGPRPRPLRGEDGRARRGPGAGLGGSLGEGDLPPPAHR